LLSILPKTLLNRLMGVVVLIGAVLAIAIVLWVGRSARENMREVAESEQIRILAVATTLAPWIDGSVHEGLVQSHPTMDEISSWDGAPQAAVALHAALAEAVERNGLETPIFTLRVRPSHRSQVFAEPQVTHPDAMEFVLTSSESPYWLHTYPYKPDMAPTLLEGETRALGLYVDEHGEWISAYAPIWDHEDRVVGILEVDAPLSSLLAEVRRKTNNQIVIALVAFVLMMVAVALLLSRMTSSLSGLEASAARFGRGDYDTEIHAEGVREVEQLAETLESARRQIRAHVVAQREHERALAQALDAAQRATHAKSTFLANMSHELRTPMNAILGYSELLMEDADDLGQENMLEDLRKIHAAGKHLLWLVNSILDLSKVEAGKMELYVETIDVPQVVEEVIATIQPLSRKNDNEIIVDIEPGIRSLDTDIVKMRQCLFNLLSNACKFTRNGTVALLVRREREDRLYMTFSVVDTGLGITDEQLDTLFQPFSQADPSTSRLFGGTGLGLALSRTLAEMMGGDLQAESQPGQGSRFTLRLPIPETSEAAQLAERGPDTVLVIDDDPSVLELMQRNLEREGFKVVTAQGGEQGLELARELRPLAITLDVLMPAMDGWEVLSALKADERTADIPVLMLTILEGRDKGFSLGAAEYLTKPIDRNRLVRALNRYRIDYGSNTVLLVEDEPDIRELMRRTLEGEGWDIREASNGVEALEALALEVPRAVLLDLMMPEMDGFQFLSEIRTNPEWGSVPVIVITAMELSVEQRRRLEVSAQRVMHKAAYSREALLRETRLVLQHLTQEAASLPYA